MASHRWWTVVPVAIGLIAATGGVARASADEPVDSPEVAELVAFVDGLHCPDLSQYGFVLIEESFETPIDVVDGVRVLRREWASNRCKYEAPDAERTVANDAEITVDMLYTPFSPVGCDDDRTESDSGSGSRRVRLASPFDDRAATLYYSVGGDALDFAPDIEAELERAVLDFADVFRPRTAFCQLPPPTFECPTLAGWTLSGIEEPNAIAIPDLMCSYDTSAARAAAEAELSEEELNEQLWDLSEYYDARLELTARWVTERSPESAFPRACEDFGPSPDPMYGTIGGDGIASQADWLYYGRLDTPFYDPDMFDAAAIDLRSDVNVQAAACSPEQITSPWSPLPGYLAELFSPSQYDAPPLPPDLVDSYGFDFSEPYVADPAEPDPAEPAALPQPAPAATTTLVTDIPPATDPTSSPPAPDSIAPVGDADLDTTGGSTGLIETLRTVVVIGGLVMSLLALAMAFVLVRRETRIRPMMDIARVAIVVVVAAVMLLVFARGAPWWAVGAAIVLGGGLGWFQGRHLVVRLVEGRPMAKRSALAIAAFGVGLVATQIAGLLNRTGIITLGIALSFLSGATTAGLIAGRRPHLVEARKAVATAAIIMVAGSIAAFAPVAAPPADAQADPDDLVDLVDWTSTELNGGLFFDEGKPPVEISVPRGFETIPEAVSRDVEWQRGDDYIYTYRVSETFSFEPNEDGECCAVYYDATGTETPEVGLPKDYVMRGRLDDMLPFGDRSWGSSVVGVPFGEITHDWWAPDDECHRDVAADPGINSVAAIDEYTVDGEAADPDFHWTYARVSIDCDVEGFDAQAALAEIEALELADRNERASQCPANAEIYPALADGSELEYESLPVLGMLFTEPHESACVGGGELGTPLPGNTRSQFTFEFASPDEREVADATTMSLITRPSEISDEYQCDVTPDGQIITGGPDAPYCHRSTWHLLDDLGSWLTVESDNAEDGPNVSVTAALPWGTYRYRCHYCEPGDSEITRWIGAMHNFATNWIDDVPEQLANDDIGVGADADEPTDADDDVDDDGGPTGTADTGDTAVPDGIETTDATETSSDDNAEATTIVALLGLLGSGGLLATAIAESGHSPTQLITTIRNEGYAGLNGLLDLPPDAIVDEYGEVIVADETGMYQYGDQVGSRDEVEEWIAEGQGAIIDRQDELNDIVTEMYSDDAAADRFEQLAVDSAGYRDPITGYTRTEILQEMRDEQTSIDHLQSILDQRDAALANLQLAWAEQDYEHTRNSWDQITLQALQGMSDEVQALPGEVWDAAVNGTRTVVTELADPENWQILGETVAETLYDLAGMMAGNSFGDGAESIGDAVRFGGNLTQALGNQMVDDPLGTIAMFTGLSDLADSMDPNATLGQRLGSYALGALDIAGNFTGVGLADEALDIARAADRVGDTLDTTRDAIRIAEATDEARDAIRIVDSADEARDAIRVADATDDVRDTVRAGYAGDLGIARTPDELLDPDLLRKRDEIVIAIRNGDQDQIRALFQNGGMNDMGRLEAAGGLTDEMAQQVVRMHDEITGDAIRLGTQNTIDEFAEITNIKPTQVLVGNSGSVGPGRSVLTDADRTLVVVFDDDQLDAWRHTNQVYDGDTFRTPTRLEAQETLQQQFTQMHQDRVGTALNPSTSSTVHLSPDDMDTSSYSGFGSMSGPNDDIYPIGYTTSRQSVQGSTDVYRIDKTGEVRSYSTSGQAIIDQNEITRNRLGNADLCDLTTRSNMTPDQMRELDTYLSNRFSDPTRIDASEMNPLLQQQVHAVEKYDDVKSISKAVDRTSYVSSRTGRPLSNDELVKAAVNIRTNPTSTVTVLRELGLSEEQFTDACRQMVLEYGAGA